MKKKCAHIVQSAQPKFILADDVLPYRLKASFLGRFVASTEGKVPWVICGADDRYVPPVKLTLDDPAIVQYDAGTTGGNPKGAIFTHGKIFYSFVLFVTRSRIKTTPTVSRGFLCVYHDLGLFMVILRRAMSFCCQMTAMSQALFLKNPLLWISYMSQYRITHSAAPNFAFSLCLDKLLQMDTLGLQACELFRVEKLSSGGEPVDHDVMKRLLPLLQEH